MPPQRSSLMQNHGGNGTENADYTEEGKQRKQNKEIKTMPMSIL
jgi:hypothetical protein